MDLKNIKFFKNRDSLVNIGIIVFALIIAKNIYTSQVKAIDVLKVRKDAELKKNAVISDLKGIEKTLSAYKKTFPERDTSSVINNITRLAGTSQIKIASIKPERMSEFDAYNKISVKLSIEAADYHKIGDFVSRLENSSQFYIIDSVYIISIDFSQEENKKNKLNAELLVSSIIFKG